MFELRKELLRIVGSCLVRFCNVKGERVDFVFRKGTTLLIVNNNGNIVDGFVLLIDYCSHV